jgi:hypothetical protein
MKFLKHKKEPWHIAAARYCFHDDKGFTLEELTSFIKETYPKVSKSAVRRFFEDEIKNPAGFKNGRQHIEGGVKTKSPDSNQKWINTNRWSAPLDLVSKVTDYDELKEARKNAKQARNFSLGAIAIAILTIFVSLGIALFSTQDVKLDSINFQNITQDLNKNN